MVKTCPICGEEFKPNHGNRKYCSAKCYKKTKRKYIQQYYQKHKKELQEYKRQYYQEHREIILERQRQRYRQQRNIIPRCVELGYSCFECPYEDCRY